MNLHTRILLECLIFLILNFEIFFFLVILIKGKLKKEEKKINGLH